MFSNTSVLNLLHVGQTRSLQRINEIQHVLSGPIAIQSYDPLYVANGGVGGSSHGCLTIYTEVGDVEFVLPSTTR